MTWPTSPRFSERTWNTLKAVMGAPGPARSPDAGTDLYRRFDNERLLLLHPFAYGRGAWAKGMTDAQYSDFLAVVGMASQTNALVTGLQLPVDSAFLIES